MSNNMIEYKENFITKIKNFFRRLFRQTKKQCNNRQEACKQNAEKQEKQKEFINEIKVDNKEVNKVVEKGNFLREIEANEESLNMLSIDRLKKLERYYDSVIAENEEKIKKLKETA